MHQLLAQGRGAWKIVRAEFVYMAVLILGLSSLGLSDASPPESASHFYFLISIASKFSILRKCYLGLQIQYVSILREISDFSTRLEEAEDWSRNNHVLSPRLREGLPAGIFGEEQRVSWCSNCKKCVSCHGSTRSVAVLWESGTG